MGPECKSLYSIHEAYLGRLETQDTGMGHSKKLVYPRYTSYFWTERGGEHYNLRVTAASRRGVDRLSEPTHAGFRVKSLWIQERSP